ncbi:DUF1771-domain-containing protein [Neolentinus lepideus HHB14362 ss-1]|uniref:DUF1771-domain-containing protein n=1 Tax=Neolentinus lepideus HHB14362 ss-1 TaxID=1314782 RepID=A0A165TJJ4_9AGAM|nr:DUF1771-domain-containing protein [Neolentinus lepideus HHB14362 ss-1]
MSILGQIFGAIIKLLCGEQQQQPATEQQPPYKPPSPGPQQGRPPEKPHVPSPPRPHGLVNQNQINQQNQHYVSLRDRAREEGAQMAKCFEESKAAYARGDRALAKELSVKGHGHEAEMERLNAQASEWIFFENNKDSQPDEIDLHGLYVKEAISYTDRAIQKARGQGNSEIRLIVGKGLHSPHGVAKLEPAIKDLMQKHGLIAELDPRNSGVLIVDLDGQSKGRGPVLSSDEILSKLKSSQEGCIIM